MKNVLTFIVPVRHPANAKNWGLLKQNLAETLGSLSLQDHSGWKGVVVANTGADLPPLPSGFETKWVDFEPNRIHERGNATQEDFYEAFRLDKGQRVLAGMLHAGEMGHAMICDDDDFVSRRLTAFVAAHPEANGWYVRDGLIWSHGRYLYRHGDFSHLCGTSHIVRADLYQLPASFEAATATYIKRMLGSHVYLHRHLDETGTPLEPLPFDGAVYRTGHPGAHSSSRNLLRQYIFNRKVMSNPVEFVRRIGRLRPKTASVEREFFGRHGQS